MAIMVARLLRAAAITAIIANCLERIPLIQLLTLRPSYYKFAS